MNIVEFVQASGANYTAGRGGRAIDGMAVHYTATSASAHNNLVYFSRAGAGASAHLFVDKDGTLVVPQSATDSILPSITRRSLVTVATDMLGMTVVERPVRFEEVASGAFVECGMCGTAAVISPVGKVVNGETEVVFGEGGMEHVGPVMAKLRETLTGIQSGEIDGPEGWVVKIC